MIWIFSYIILSRICILPAVSSLDCIHGLPHQSSVSNPSSLLVFLFQPIPPKNVKYFKESVYVCVCALRGEGHCTKLILEKYFQHIQILLTIFQTWKMVSKGISSRLMSLRKIQTLQSKPESFLNILQEQNNQNISEKVFFLLLLSTAHSLKCFYYFLRTDVKAQFYNELELRE